MLALCSAATASAASLDIPPATLPLLVGLLKGAAAPPPFSMGSAPLTDGDCGAEVGPAPCSSVSSMLRVMLAVTSRSCPPRFRDTCDVGMHCSFRHVL